MMDLILAMRSDPLVEYVLMLVDLELPVWDDGRIALKDKMKFATRKYRASYG